MKVVIDTNVLLVSISSRSAYHWLFKCIIERKISIAFTNDILAEYEEIISARWNSVVANSVIRMLLELDSAEKTEVYFNWNLIPKDPDDNKFVDCAFAANATYIITNDAHFNVLKQVGFPRIFVLTIQNFKNLLIERQVLIE